jgi:hypothetical protein
VRQTVARILKSSGDVIYPLARAELDEVHRSLDRFQGDSITPSDLYVRCNGKSIESLMASLAG